MAYVDIPALKRSIADQLAAVLPNTWDGQPIPVDYAWPGSDNQKNVHVWMFNARSISEPGSMGAGTKRRDQVWTIEIIVEVRREGATVESGRNVLQQKVDATVMEVVGTIDDWVATNPTLGQTTTADVPVDYATFDGCTLQEGVHATGASARGTCQISARIRPR